MIALRPKSVFGTMYFVGEDIRYLVLVVYIVRTNSVM